MKRYLEVGRPSPGNAPFRSASFQAGAGPAHIDAWLDTGYEDSLFEYSFSIGLGPWRLSFCWYRPR